MIITSPHNYTDRPIQYTTTMSTPQQPLKQHIKPHFLIKTFIAYLYFIQGFYLSLGGTVILLYAKYPSPDVLSHFSIAFLPFSFKYITAPLVEKFTFVKYGRRKFAIVVSLFITTILTFPLIKNLTNQQQHIEVVAILFVMLLFVSMGDISLDAASVKQLDNPVLSSYIQVFFQSLGNISGGLLLLKFVTPQANWYLFTTKKPICSAQTYTLFVGLLNFVVGLLLHFFYKQRVLQQQARQELPSFKKIFKYYKHFLNPRYKLCRFTIYLLTFNQGVKSFSAGYQYESIQRGFDKNSVPEILTICVFLTLAVNSIVKAYLNQHNMWSTVRKVYWFQLLFATVIFFSGSFHKYVVIGTIITVNITHLTAFMLNSTKVNTFGQSMMAGVCVTTLASFLNFGNNSWLQLKIIAIIGYEYSVWLGLIYALVMGIFAGKFMHWIDQGQPERHQLWNTLQTEESKDKEKQT